jgi:hypothetical protein
MLIETLDLEDKVIYVNDRQTGSRNAEVMRIDGLTGAVTYSKPVTLPAGSVAKAAGVTIVDAGSKFTATNVEAALAEVKTLADAGMTVQKRTVTVGHADLTDADGSQTVNIGAVLPANSRIIGVDIRALTAFSGGTNSAIAVDIGTSGDVDALVDGADLFAAAVDGGPATMPKGVRPNKTFATAGAQLTATFLATGDTLLALTAGAVTIDVLFAVLA